MGNQIPTESGAGVIAGRGNPYRVKIRRDLGRGVKPEAEGLDGKVFVFRLGWIMDQGDPYPGEIALIPNDFDWPADAPAWVPSGDLEPLVAEKPMEFTRNDGTHWMIEEIKRDGKGDKTFSFYASVPVQVLKRRKWWNLFGRDALVTETQVQRFSFAGISDEMAKLISTLRYRGYVPTPCGQATMAQLETGLTATPYIPTTAHRPPDNASWAISDKTRLDTLQRATSGSVGFPNGDWVNVGEDWRVALDEVTRRLG